MSDPVEVTLTLGTLWGRYITYFLIGFALAAKIQYPRLKIKKMFMGKDIVFHGLITRENNLEIEPVKYQEAISRGDNSYSLVGQPIRIKGLGSLYIHHWDCIAPYEFTYDAVQKAKARLAAEHPDVDNEEALEPKIKDDGLSYRVTVQDIMRGLTADNTGLVYRYAKNRGAATGIQDTIEAVKKLQKYVYVAILVSVIVYFTVKDLPTQITGIQTTLTTLAEILPEGWGIKE